MNPLIDEMAVTEEPGDLSPEDRAIIEEREKRAKAEWLAKLDALGQSLARTRAEAINGRQQSGCEEEWLEDEEHYQGIDDANRGEHKSAWRTKPPGQAAPESPSTTRSTVFPNITAPYVDAAAARIADMLLPTDDRSWAMKPTPIPELDEIADGRYPPELVEAAKQQPQPAPMPQGQMPQGMAPMPQGGQPEVDPVKAKLAAATEQALRIIEEAKAKADKAQTRIDDWMIECQWHAQVRKVIEDAARIGVGVLKGPVPIKKSRNTYRDGTITRITEIKPGSKWIDPWNFYPDPACGEDIHNGSYTWERDWLTRKQLEDLLEVRDQAGEPLYIAENILECLREGPQLATAVYKPTPDEQSSDPVKRNRFEIWYYAGRVEREDLEAMGCDCGDEEENPVLSLPAVLEVVNNRVIKASIAALDLEEFTYDVFVWRRKSGHWTGHGVGRQGREAQNIVKAATRNLMDNAGLAGGPMLVMRQGVVYPADGVAGIAPRKVYYIAEDAEEIADATKAIGQIKVDMLVKELMEIIQYGLKLMEDVTGLPLILQGQQGKAPDTVGGMTMLNNNATAVLRRLARQFDDRITEPHVRRYYSWLMQYGEDEEKGDYCIDARGSSALVERDLQNQEIPQLLQASANPIFGIDPKKTMQEYLKSRHFDPKRFEFDDEEWKQIVANMAKGPQDPRLEVARIASDTDLKIEELRQREKDLDRKVEVAQFQIETALRGEELTQEGKQALDDLKAGLADTVMKLRTQVQLSRETRAASRQDAREGRVHDRQKNRENNQHKTLQALKPPTEPAQRAKPGKAWQQ